jgi:hypothetical protein
MSRGMDRDHPDGGHASCLGSHIYEHYTTRRAFRFAARRRRPGSPPDTCNHGRMRHLMAEKHRFAPHRRGAKADPSVTSAIRSDRDDRSSLMLIGGLSTEVQCGLSFVEDPSRRRAEGSGNRPFPSAVRGSFPKM